MLRLAVAQRDVARRALLGAGGLAAFAVLWQLVAVRLNSLLLPTFTDTLVALARLLVTPRLWEALWTSNQALVLGYGLAVAVGVPLGLLMGRWRAAEGIINPYLSILLATPISAVMPLIVMATGLGLVSRTLIVFSFAVVVIVANARAGMRMVDPGWIDMARSYGAGELQLWRKVLLRGTLPATLTGLRLGLMRAVTGMLTVELLLVSLGLGQMILEFQGTFEAASLYATVMVVVTEALLLLWIGGRLAALAPDGNAGREAAW